METYPKLLNYTKPTPTPTSELTPIIIQMIKSVMVNNIINNKQVRTNKIVQRKIHLINMS